MNRVILIGNVGQDAELRFTAGGQAVLSFSLATTEKWKDGQGQLQERTDWHKVSLWGKRGEALEPYVTKGSRIAVEGRVQYRQYEDREGNKRTATDIVATDVELLGAKNGERGSGGGSSSSRGSGSGSRRDDSRNEFNDDDIPF